MPKICDFLNTNCDYSININKIYQIKPKLQKVQLRCMNMIYCLRNFQNIA